MSSEVSSLLAGKRILVVEGEGVTQLLMNRILTRAGLIVVGQVADVAEALAIIGREKPDIVTIATSLTDIDNLDVIQDVVAAFFIPVVVVQTHDTQQDRQRAREAGAKGYVVKPVQAEALIAELERCCREEASPKIAKRAPGKTLPLRKAERSASTPTRVLFADDHAMIRETLANALSAYDRIEVVAIASSGREAVECYRRLLPDVVLMDVRMADMDGIEATAEICREFPDARVVMLSVLNTDEDAYRAFSAGAKAYILKESPLSMLIAAIEVATTGKITVTPELAQLLVDRIRSEDLTAREQQILELIAKGVNNRQIAIQLLLTGGTVKYHMNSLLKKLQVTDRTNALIVGLKWGLVSLE